MVALHAPPQPPGHRRGGRLQRVASPGALGAAALAGVAALAVRDPHQPGSWGFCPIRLGLGVDCPGCGGLRAVHDLTQGDLAAAFSSNVVLVSALPLVAALWVVWLASRWRGRPVPGSSRAQLVAGVAFAAVLLAFGVVRNLPGLEWLLS